MMEKITKMIKVLRFLRILRESHPTTQSIYTEGSCYYLYLLLKEMFPEAEPYYDQNHVITKIDDTYYDITGIVEKERHIPMEEKYQQELSHYTEQIVSTIPLPQLGGDITLFSNGNLYFRTPDKVVHLIWLTKKDLLSLIDMCVKGLNKYD